MASIEGQNNRKWVNTTVVLGAAMLVFIAHAALVQFADWFDLEAKVNNFNLFSQGAALLVGLISYFAVVKNEKAVTYLDDVYGELVKVVWPDKDSVFKLTIGIIIAVGICSSVLVLVDLGIQKLLALLY